jgi:hypothetical protein
MGAGSPLAPSLLNVTSVTGANAAKNGAVVLLGQLESQGVDCIFASPIAVVAPVREALARRGNDTKPRYFRCRHELLAVSLASGYYKATGSFSCQWFYKQEGAQLRLARHRESGQALWRRIQNSGSSGSSPSRTRPAASRNCVDWLACCSAAMPSRK